MGDTSNNSKKADPKPTLGPTGPSGGPGDPGPPGIVVSGLELPAPRPTAAAVQVEVQKVKSYIILIRHVTKGTLHVVARGNGAIAEFEDVEQAVNTATTIPSCQRNPHFIQPLYE